MRKKVLVLIVIITTIISFQSCKKNKNDEKDNIEKSTLINFLDKYYTSNYTLGKKVFTTDENSNSLLIQEVLTPSNNKGYVVLNNDDKSIMYFANFDFNTNEISIDDKYRNEKVTINNSSVFKNTTVHNLNLIKDINVKYKGRWKRRFWGWACGPEYSTSLSDCNRTCCYYILWTRNGCDVYLCSNLPGSNPRLE